MIPAIALIIFNRPETTEQVFAAIAQAKPSQLFVIADSPRPDHFDDWEKCTAARKIVERINWKCDVYRNYSDVNLGCGRRPATGVTWVFESVEEAIILEDDCVPDPSFFRFCEELLEKYREDERVMMISGRNNLPSNKRQRYSYHFARIPNCWGWATWRRAWRYHDQELKLWPELRNTRWLQDILRNEKAVEYFGRIFDRVHGAVGNLSYWDYQWSFACWAQNGLAVIPNNNLVANIGFGKTASHTHYVNDYRANISAEEMKFPLHHPAYVIWDSAADELRLARLLKRKPSALRQLRRKLAATVPAPLRKAISRLLRR